MPDPNWTAEYNTGNTPEQNGFSRTLYNSPVVTATTSGPPAGRNVEINSDNGDAVFITSQVPSLDPTLGASAEMDVEVVGAGDAGFEMTFLNSAVLVNIFQNSVNVSIPTGDDGTGASETDVATADNGDAPHTWRYLFDSSRNVSLYRDEVLVVGPIAASTITKPFQRVLWWGEGGGTQTYWGFRYYTGGAVIPG
jgi:hypothetical protein